MKYIAQLCRQPYRDYLSIMCAMTRKDIFILKSKIVDLLINSTIVLIIELLIWTKLYPQFGMSTELVVPMFVGWTLPLLMLHLGFGFSSKYTVGALYTGYGFMEYHLTLPLPTSLVIAQYVVSFFIESALVTIPLVIGGLVFLLYSGCLFQGSISLFFLIYLLNLALCGSTFLALSFWYKAQWFEDNLWPRRIGPLLTIGALFYPWYKVYAYSKVLGLLMLANPLTYVAEGMRVALLAGDVYISLPICMAVLFFSLVGASYWVVHSVKVRLDLL